MKESIETKARKYAQGSSEIRDHYLQGALEQERADFWKARRAFCNATCPGGCPQKKDDIEGGGGLAVSCDKLSLFIISEEGKTLLLLIFVINNIYMEIHKFICDCCGKELEKDKWTISQYYNSSHYDGLDESWEHRSVNHVYHLCPGCWKKVESLIIKQ